MIQSNGGQFYVGVVEDRNDPLQLGRVRARVVGLHFHDKTVLPTSDLPWAMLMQPAAGTGSAIIGPPEGSTVIVIFNDWPDNQQPIVIGRLGGIPQENNIFVDKFEDTPLFKDNITPAGRKVPVNAAEATGNQIGPMPPDAVNPMVTQLVTQSQQQTTNTAYGAVQNILGATSQTMGSVGGLLGAIGGVGSTYGIAKSSFEDLLRTYGNKDTALQQFKTVALQSGPLGSAISTVLNGNASLKSIARDLGFGTITNIQSSFNAVRNTRVRSVSDLVGVVSNAEQIAGQIGSTASDLGKTLSTIYGEASQVTLGGTVSSIGGSVGAIVSSITSSLGGTASAALAEAQRAASILGLGDITSGGQDAIKTAMESPAKIAELINKSYSSEAAAATGAGNMAVLKTENPSEVTSETFKDVDEGSTPPIKGAYGGPNFGGASPVLVVPTQDMTKYSGGSKADLKLSPPSDWTGDRSTAERNIQYLIDACTKYGLSTNEQKAALLGIVGGECGWIPQNESCQYSNPNRLCEIFKTTFKGDTTLASKYANWVKGNKGSTSEFFNFVYDPANNGRQLGNTQPGDGGKFYGRGYIQLTGRANYQRYSTLSGHNILDNPDLLNDPKVGAEIAVLYLMDRVKNAVPTAHPGYFYAAKKAVGNNSPDIAARKLKYYEHFYGLGTPESYGYADKQAGNSQSPNTYDGAMSGNESGKPDNRGFRDPNNKYPLKRTHNEPDTNRLARGVVGETIVALKQSKRTTGIPVAMQGGSWNQPSIPYGAKYPYNEVRESESGHVHEIDDTPGYERIHTYHRSGTFEEIDANGTKVTKIVGDGYILFDRNGYISIEGEANVTVAGNVNIFCRSDANIEVAGSAEMKIGGSFDVGVARDMNIAVEGDFSLWANGAMNLQSKGMGHIRSNANMHVSSNEQIHMQSTTETFIESKTAINAKAATVIAVQAAETIGMKSGGNFSIHSAADATVVAAGDTYVSAGGQANTTAGGDVALDGSNVHLNSGVATEGTAIEGDVPASTKALIHGMVPPPPGAPIYPNLGSLSSIEMLGEEQFMYELPQDGQTGASKAYNEERTAQEGKANTYESETESGSGGSGTVKPSSKQAEILAMTDFTADFKLSEHFTLGMMFDGGFNVRHRLINQCGLTKQQIVANLSALCENVLEKYLTVLPGGINGYNKQWRISSGYRMADSPVNSSTSDHPKGRACDIQLTSRNKDQMFELIKVLDKLVPYDQLLLEYSGASSVWIHTGFKGDGNTTFGGGTNRKMAFTMKDHKKYKDGFVLLA